MRVLEDFCWFKVRSHDENRFFLKSFAHFKLQPFASLRSWRDFANECFLPGFFSGRMQTN